MVKCDLSEKTIVRIKRRRYRKALVIALVAAISLLLGLGYRKLDESIPERITILKEREELFDFSLPLEAEIEAEDAGTFFINQEPLSSEQLKLNFNEAFTVKADETGSYPASIRLFGLFRLKQVVIDVIESTEIIPCGVPIGIIADTDGVLVLGTGTVTMKSGGQYEPEKTLLLSGDYIIGLNGHKVESKEKLIEMVQESDGASVCLTIRRKGNEMEVFVPVVASTTGERKLGVWVRDDTQGIGTLTFITSDGEFCALGHGITDVDTGILMEFVTGEIYTAEINAIKKGQEGEPGELTGVIHQGDRAKVGLMLQNTSQGICGTLLMHIDQLKKVLMLKNTEPYEIAFWNEIKVGAASIICTVDDQPGEYSIEIEKVEPNGESLSKGMIIHITDERLIEKTGGIVQGMSGSPIIQNGKLIGAVTHVFVRDSTRGYGIFIENMLKLLAE